MQENQPIWFQLIRQVAFNESENLCSLVSIRGFTILFAGTDFWDSERELNHE